MISTSLHRKVLQLFLVLFYYGSEGREKHIMFNLESWKVRRLPVV